jgi:CheY-like chemotaxis protein/anti-sigma regulatory factor (Ser/Thr protein kinase)
LLQSRQEYDEHGVRIIQEQTRQMARLVDDLGDAVRLEAGQFELWPEALDLNVVAQGAVERAQTQTDGHLIQLQPSTTPVVGSWDQIRLEEVLDNLLGNAIKYSPAGGEIIVRVESTETEAWLRVADQGAGISVETLPRLFERFHRGEETGTAGLGLGLYITRMLVEAHHGLIDVQSVPGEGSLFTVRLPLTNAAKIASDLASQPPVPQEMTEAAPIRVLIADDHAMVRDGLRLLLTQDPAIVVVGESATGREAVRLAHELHPDVVLMDRLMPEMDGLAATAAIRQEVPSTAVLMVSGVPREHGAEEARRAGAVGYLDKDSDAEEMRRAVHAACAGRGYPSAR